MDDRNSLDAPTIVGAVSPEQLLEIEEMAFPEIDGYEIIRELGRGGMGVVYLAKQQSLGRMVALKTMPARSDDEFERLLLAEAQIVAKLNHPGIIPIYEARTHKNFWCFSMGLVVGEDLAHRLARGVFSADQVARLAVQIADALQHAHEQGVLHLDIKPANILLDANESPKLADFGISAVLANNSESIAQIGTPQFMSPEQATGDAAHFGPASDIYSLGAVMYAALTGRPPIVSANMQDLIARILAARPAAMRQAGVRVPMALEAIVMKCLEKGADKRYPSAADLKLDLIAFQEGKPVSARPPGWLTSALYLLRQHVFAASISGSLAILLLLLLGVLVFRSYGSQSEINSLLDENQRLRQLANVQREQFRGTIESNVAKSDQAAIEYQLFASMAVKLSELGDSARAAQYAAEAYKLASSSEIEVGPEVRKIILDFGQRQQDAAGEQANAGQAADTSTRKDDEESKLQQLSEAILSLAEQERIELENSQAVSGVEQAKSTGPSDALKMQQGEE